MTLAKHVFIWYLVLRFKHNAMSVQPFIDFYFSNRFSTKRTSSCASAMGIWRDFKSNMMFLTIYFHWCIIVDIHHITIRVFTGKTLLALLYPFLLSVFGGNLVLHSSTQRTTAALQYMTIITSFMPSMRRTFIPDNVSNCLGRSALVVFVFFAVYGSRILYPFWRIKFAITIRTPFSF